MAAWSRLAGCVVQVKFGRHGGDDDAPATQTQDILPRWQQLDRGGPVP